MENKKYKLVNVRGRTRIQALKDFKTIDGNTVYKDDIGAEILGFATLSQEGKCWADYNSCLQDNCIVSDDALVKNSNISHYAMITDSTCVESITAKDAVYIGGNARVNSGTLVKIHVSGDSIIAGNVTINLKLDEFDDPNVFINDKILFEKEVSFEDEYGSLSKFYTPLDNHNVTYRSNNYGNQIDITFLGKNVVQHDISNYKKEIFDIRKKCALHNTYFKLSDIKREMIKDIADYHGMSLGSLLDGFSVDENKDFNRILEVSVESGYYPKDKKFDSIFDDFVKQNHLDSVFVDLSDKERNIIREYDSWLRCENGFTHSLDDFKYNKNPFNGFLFTVIEKGFVFCDKENREFAKAFAKENKLTPFGYYQMPDEKQKMIDEILDWKCSRKDRIVNYYDPIKKNGIFTRCYCATDADYAYENCLVNAVHMEYMPKEEKSRKELLHVYGNYLLREFTNHFMSMEDFNRLFKEKEEFYGLSKNNENNNDKNNNDKNNNKMNVSLKPLKKSVDKSIKNQQEENEM